MIDPVQLIEMTIYSKLISEVSSTLLGDIRIVSLLGMLYFLYKNIPTKYYSSVFSYIYDSPDSFIVIPSHKKTYIVSGYTAKEVTKIKYSHRFKALHYYLLHTCAVPFSQLYEIMEITDTCKEYTHTESDEYILMPYQNHKVKICNLRNIYLEISILAETTEDKDEKQKKTSQSYKQYLCKISTPSYNPKVLHEFLDECIAEHNKYLSKTINRQCIFEYVKTEYDDNDRKVAKYLESPFISNKHLTKNIFFPEKKEFIKQLDKFVHNREKHQAEYEESGQTYKLTVVLHGLPGTGKTCIVRGMLNYTGRDAVIVPWSNLKTCRDLSSILRSNKFNGKSKELKDLIFIFEDFDANYSKVLKARKSKTAKGSCINDDNGDSTDITILANKLNDSANGINMPNELLEQIKSLKEYAANTMTMVNKPMEDELTLEYVLNMFDGIVEQHDAIIVFTTNHIDDIDPAAIRPGRVDYMLELKNASKETIKEMLSSKYGEVKDEELKKVEAYKISPALVQNSCFKYESVEEVIESLERICVK